MCIPNPSAIATLKSSYPSLPTQPPIGRSFEFYRDRLIAAGLLSPGIIPGHLCHAVGQLTRSQVRSICRAPNIDPILGYAAVMAWGGQNFRFFETSILSPNLAPLLHRLKSSTHSRAADFDCCLGRIKGVGIAYFTKLLFFFRPLPDAYILDQWTAKGVVFLCGKHSPIRLDRSGHAPAPNTHGLEYDSFCQCLERYARGMGWTAEQVEIAIFGKPMRPNYGRSNTHETVKSVQSTQIISNPIISPVVIKSSVTPPPRNLYLRIAHGHGQIYAIAENHCGGPNIGYVSRTGPNRAGEIACYPRLNQIFTEIGVNVNLDAERGPLRGAPAAVLGNWGVNAGNIITNGQGQHNHPIHAWAECGLNWLGQYFDLKFCP